MTGEGYGHGGIPVPWGLIAILLIAVVVAIAGINLLTTGSGGGSADPPAQVDPVKPVNPAVPVDDEQSEIDDDEPVYDGEESSIMTGDGLVIVRGLKTIELPADYNGTLGNAKAGEAYVHTDKTWLHVQIIIFVKPKASDIEKIYVSKESIFSRSTVTYSNWKLVDNGINSHGDHWVYIKADVDNSRHLTTHVDCYSLSKLPVIRDNILFASDKKITAGKDVCIAETKNLEETRLFCIIL